MCSGQILKFMNERKMENRGYSLLYDLFYNRWTYEEFFGKYYMLVPCDSIDRQNVKKTCENILRHHIEVSHSWSSMRTPDLIYIFTGNSIFDEG